MAKKLFVILGNQLFDPELLKGLGCTDVFMAEDYALCTYEKHHKLKLYLFLCSMREYRDELERAGIAVSYFQLETREQSCDYIELLDNFAKEQGFDEINFFEIEDKFFEDRIKSEKHLASKKLIFHTSPMFMFSREEFESIHSNSKVFRLANFYKLGRKKFQLLINSDREPTGGKWSFDDENRKRIPTGVNIPKLELPKQSKYHNEIISIIENNFPHHPGSLGNIWFPVKRADVQKQLSSFLDQRLTNFGVYEDAMREGENFLVHSCISPFLNIGLITPENVISRIVEHFNLGFAPLNSVEGYIRQVLGWREFIRGIYQLKGNEQSESNFWSHHRKLTSSWYEGSTGIVPLDDCIRLAIRDGYGHHIPRLMVISNLMTLCEIDPKSIYKWFMEMFIDSSDWVMVPNVFGMATYSDGGLMSTKPYTCGSNYLLKMSNYKKGEWCNIVDGLYWRFIEKNKQFYGSNPRLSFQTRMLEKMSNDRRVKIFQSANKFLETHTSQPRTI